MISPSWSIVYTSAPKVKYPYNPDDALSDIPGVCYAMELFLASSMIESETYCNQSDQRKERLYFATGYGLIQCIKGLMSYADEDLLAAIGHTKRGNHIANLHRRKAGLIGTILGTTGLTDHSAFIRGMTDVERHAELVYAESLFEKALLGIVYSGDWLAFIKEVLNMRATISIYRHLYAFLEETDAAYAASLSASSSTTSVSSGALSDYPSSFISLSTSFQSQPRTPATTTSAQFSSPSSPGASKKPMEDPSIDPHFRSGVYLGAGMFNIILSLMPGKLATFVELFGYHGDRKAGLKLLARAGGWEEDNKEPMVSTSNEGVRRSICDMALLIFHLIFSSFTVDCVDIKMASRIVDWNLKRYPNGVFFLFGAGRLALQRSRPREAIAYYSKAMHVQDQYRNLHHVSLWEIAMARLSLYEIGEHIPVNNEEKLKYDVSGSAACWRVLQNEGGWSKCIYTYGLAVCLLENWESDIDDRGAKNKRRKEASRLLATVSGLRQKIAGKSIPMEKFVARKARKYASQNNRLILPALELGYIFQSIAHAPRGIIVGKMIPEVKKVLKKLTLYGPGAGTTRSSYECDGYGKKNRQNRDNVKALGPNKYEGGASEFWDDLCLARFLEGVCLRFVAYPDLDATLDPQENVGITTEEAVEGADAAFRAVLEYGPKIELDHHLVYYAHYELGRLLACQGKVDEAKIEFELVLSGKYLEVGSSGRKGKYSLENLLLMRTHAALDALRTDIHNSRRL